MSYNREERKSLQDVIHMARLGGHITNERCTELCTLVERETAPEKHASEKQAKYYPIMQVFSSQWMVGRIENHTAKPLTREEVEQICERLNESA